MKRVLLLADSPYMGGVASHILSVAEAFRSHDRYEAIVASLPGIRPDNTLLRAAQAQDITVHLLPMASRLDVRILARLRRFVRDHGIDLVHTHGYRTTIFTALGCLSAANLNTCHGAIVADRSRPAFWQSLEIRLMRRRRLVVACSTHVRDWLAQRGVDSRNIRVVHNGVQAPSAVPRIERNALGLDANTLLVAYVGRLVPGKGLEHLIAALGRTPQATGLFVGDGPLRAAMEDAGRRCNANLRFAGAVDNPWPYYELADVIALPSMMEALPMTLIEAAAAGKPCIASRVGGIPEIIRDGETGVLVEYGSVPQLADAIRGMADPHQRQEMGRHARDVWSQYFTPDRMARDLAAVYDTCLGERNER